MLRRLFSGTESFVRQRHFWQHCWSSQAMHIIPRIRKKYSTNFSPSPQRNTSGGGPRKWWAEEWQEATWQPVGSSKRWTGGQGVRVGSGDINMRRRCDEGWYYNQLGKTRGLQRNTSRGGPSRWWAEERQEATWQLVGSSKRWTGGQGVKVGDGHIAMQRQCNKGGYCNQPGKTRGWCNQGQWTTGWCDKMWQRTKRQRCKERPCNNHPGQMNCSAGVLCIVAICLWEKGGQVE